ncbi:MAG: hypothetical protein CMJ78_23660 [Planctomycetaceae bacterium]|nr:hypothetical protein [Planctomycetaceae bacterium]
MVSDRIALKDAVDAAQQKFAQFLDDADNSRFYASLVLGDSIERDTNKARDLITKAVDAYDLAGDTPLDVLPEHLSNEQIGQIRQTAYELFINMAESEITLANATGAEDLKKPAERALGWLDKATKIGDPSRALYFRRQRYYQLIGDDTKAEAAKVEANQVQPSTAVDFYLLTEVERVRKNYAAAVDLCQQALIINPDDFWVTNQQGVCHLLNQNAAAAASVFTGCIGKRPKSALTYCIRGAAFARLGQYDEALDDFDRAHELDPELFAIYQNRGFTNYKLGNIDAAIDDTERASELSSKSPAPLINLGIIELERDALPKSLGLFTKALQLDARNARAYLLRGQVYIRLSDPESARKDFEQSIRFDRTVTNVAEC